MKESLLRMTHAVMLCILAAPLLLTSPVQAASKYWISGTSGWWDNASNWNPAGQPQSGDNVWLSQFGDINRTVWYRNADPLICLNRLTIDNMTSTGTTSLNHDMDSLLSTWEIIGDNGIGAYVQTGGTNTVEFISNNTVARFILGNASMGRGTYDLSGTGTLSSQREIIGNAGDGIFSHTDGTNTTDGLYLGSQTDSFGRYDLSGTGNLTTVAEYIGDAGAGGLFQTGGTNNTTTVYIAYSTGTGNYDLSGTGDLSAYMERVGYSGVGLFRQSGGTNNADFLTLGENASGSGTYDLIGGTLSSVNSQVIGGSGSGIFLHSNGTNTVPILALGESNTGVGRYTFTGGSLDVNYAYIGYNGTGTFTQTAGTNPISGLLILGQYGTGDGTYTLSGASLSPGSTYVGYEGNGSFIQNGGTHAVATNLDLAHSTSTSNGSYELSGGGALSAYSESIGVSGIGIFTHFSGTNSITDRLELGNGALSRGTYDLQNGSLSANVEFIGIDGQGHFYHRGGTNTITTNLYLGYSNDSRGTYRIWDGSLDVGGSIIGKMGDIFSEVSLLELNGGSLSVGGDITVTSFNVAQAVGSDMTYTHAGGSLFVNGDEYIGLGGTGAVIQTGGTHTINGFLKLGSDGDIPASGGTYTLSGGTLDVGAAIVEAYSPNNGANMSTLNLDGGTLTVHGGIISVDNLYLATSGGSAGSYTLNAGETLMIHNEEVVGFLSSGSLIQNGGTHSVGGVLSIGEHRFSDGEFELNGGSLSVAGNEFVGKRGFAAGHFIQTGGIHTVGGTLALAVSSIGSSGIYDLKGGELHATAIQVNLHGSFNFDGGLLSVDSFTGNLLNNGGTLSPGNSPGATVITDDYTQLVDGILEVEIGGLLQDDEYDRLDVGGSAILGGTLDVSLFDFGNGLFDPSLGDYFDILTAETIESKFDLLTLAPLGAGLIWDVTYILDDFGTDFMRLSVIQDTDGDGISDDDEINIYGTDPNDTDSDDDNITDGNELDYWGSSWNTNYDGDGITNNLLDNDADGDGFLDGDEISSGYDPTDPNDYPGDTPTLIEFAAAYGSVSSDMNYVSACDFDGDGDVDGYDLAEFVAGF